MSLEYISQPGAATVIPLNDIGNYETFGATPNDNQQLSKLIGRRHPEYVNHIAQWKFFGDTYEGGRDWFGQNIFKYFREGNQEYNERVERCYRFNHTKEVVDLLNKYLFKQNIVRSEDAPKSVLEFWKHATRGGQSIDELAKKISKHCSIYGRIGIVVDRQRPPQNVVTIADEKRQKVRTYAYVVNPQDMLDYSFDEEGKLNWILIRETYRNDSDPFAEDSISEKIRYRLWTRMSWFLIAEKKKEKGVKTGYELVDQGEHSLGEVPVILADNLLSDEMYGAPSLINDIAYLDRACANYLSNIDTIIQDQTFSQLVMPAQNIMAGSEEEQQLMELGTKRVFTYDAAGSNHSPEYIFPDHSQAHLILDVVSRIIKEIYNSVGLSSERTNKDNAVSMDNSSGVAKAYDFERVNALLSAKADSLESVENQIARIVALWNGETISEDLGNIVAYPDNFDTRGLYDEFDIAARLMLIEAPDTIRQQSLRLIVDKLFPMLKKKLRDEMEAEIKKWPASMREMQLDAVSTRTSQNNLTSPKSTVYKSKSGGKGDATKAADGSAADNKRPEATNRQGEVPKHTK